ncbi:putative amidoligase enzyme-domain-containing protein [Annulohypoxylon moriforme]|nr:putative amidoligase enzyme-domain-containing protein [Annulohypoxylon moriforme]
MSTQHQNFPAARQRTFGVELEIVVPWLWEDEPDPHEATASQLPPILRLPVSLKAAYDSTIIEENDKVINFVYNAFTNTLISHGLPAENLYGSSDAGSSLDSTTTEDYTKWCIKGDDTVSEFGGGYKWYGMEIVSPAEVASDKAFQLIRYALNVLKSNFRITVNRTCGFHVHVGDGPELMPLDHVRRVAGLFWAADPLLALLHPPNRRTAYYSQSIRERSNLAHGMTASQKDKHEFDLACCNVYIGGRVRHGEAPVSWREKYHEKNHLITYGKTRQKGHFEPFFMKDPHDKTEVKNDGTLPLPSYCILNDANSEIDVQVEKYAAGKGSWDAIPNTPYESTRERKTRRRLAYPRYSPDEFTNIGFTDLEYKASKDIGVWAGIREIFSCSTSCVIEWLLRAGDRPNYSLAVYSCFGLDKRGTRPGTIEFREAAGTVDGLWAETWARICVGLTNFAIHAPVEKYLAVLSNIDRAADEGGDEGAAYDVLDLLDQVGLSAEAELVEKRLLENEKEWGLTYIAPSTKSGKR